VARNNGVKVLLDGNGMDEQWCGYDYYQRVIEDDPAGLVQGTSTSPVRPDCLVPAFRDLAGPSVPNGDSGPFADRVRNLQYRDTFHTKIPRALRFNDRVSMRSSTELREPFLDHRLFEIAFRQPTDRKISNGTRKKLLRETVSSIVPASISSVPKRPLQTPQREWLRGELRGWAEECKNAALSEFGGVWLEKDAINKAWSEFCNGESDNSYYVWQWISLHLVEKNFHVARN
jgi:asparagine synthase (glutamine-hydrolysing)